MVVSENIQEIEETTIKKEEKSTDEQDNKIEENQEKNELEEIELEKIENEIEKEEINQKEEKEMEFIEVRAQKEDIEEKENLPQQMEERENKEHILKKDNFETGIEIQFTSLNLKNFPIKDTNVSKNADILDIISLGQNDIKIGRNILRNAQLKIYVYERFKLLEIKTREFKVGIAIYLNSENTLVEKDGYFSYEIFNNLNIKRLRAVIDILKELFAGEVISFEVKKMKTWINGENRIQLHKFMLLEKSIEQYEENCQLLKTEFKVENLYRIESFYTNYLLNNYLKGVKTLESWISFKLNDSKDIIVGDSIIFEDIHKFKFRNSEISFVERIKLKNKITQNDIKNNIINCYRKNVMIETERV